MGVPQEGNGESQGCARKGGPEGGARHGLSPQSHAQVAWPHPGFW